MIGLTELCVQFPEPYLLSLSICCADTLFLIIGRQHNAAHSRPAPVDIPHGERAILRRMSGKHRETIES